MASRIIPVAPLGLLLLDCCMLHIDSAHITTIITVATHVADSAGIQGAVLTLPVSG